ncbi:hypothetical protein NDA11_001539 [Ustilago hordei]|uniref:Reverse transcriptase Ty1/copia-type domain-containing protein n=1 Tax=Ustilago hordei TaxID=120017 RepID=I2FS48_USTHO|nr:uncharacterized protein UHO2_05857 [Ustilago hordei]KAJ1041928.1 hypothetical protein NDA10_007592 [Ustilago hordei]KAJ1573242.1 hypothetical protein NDA15_002420 [Ustilago hordei]KAJ1574651.1 hypothetical protein NDA12_000259 [Ustilago hordei]KAJ1576597.1 hypothetical protein NDA11_001539 [Ustilago hordei]KAJ1596381.1 hypothetical protein NDA14_006370 [Ustilago hordei]
MINEEDAKNLGNSEVNLFDETDQGLLSEYMDMEPTVDMDKSQDLRASTNKGLEAMGTWEVMNLPPRMNTVDTKWVLKVKTDANLVPTKFKRSIGCGGCARLGDSVDVKQAYLNLNLHHNIYLKPPIGTKVPPGKVFKLKKGSYGLKQSGQEWNTEMDSHLWRMGFHCMPSTPCLYTRGTGNGITVITAYVNDMLIASPSHKEVDCTKGEIMNKWGMEDNGRIKEFLGIKITWDQTQRSVSLDLTAYIKAMVSKWLQRATEKSWVPMQDIAVSAGGNICSPL